MEWELLVWDNKRGDRRVAEDYDLVLWAWTRMHADGKRTPIDIVEDGHAEIIGAPPVFDKSINEVPGFRFLPWTDRLRAVCLPEEFAIIPRAETGITSSDGGVQLTR